MQGTYPLTVLEKGLESLRGCKTTSFGLDQGLARRIAELGLGRSGRTGTSGRAEGTGFLRDKACLKRYRQAGPDSDTDQQLERYVGYATIDDLAQRGLRQAKLFCSCDLSEARTMGVSRKLKRHIAAQSLNGSEIGGYHSHIVNLL